VIDITEAGGPINGLKLEVPVRRFYRPDGFRYLYYEIDAQTFGVTGTGIPLIS